MGHKDKKRGQISGSGGDKGNCGPDKTWVVMKGRIETREKEREGEGEGGGLEERSENWYLGFVPGFLGGEQEAHAIRRQFGSMHGRHKRPEHRKTDPREGKAASPTAGPTTLVLYLMLCLGLACVCVCECVWRCR
jgi:hypothetical protein